MNPDHRGAIELLNGALWNGLLKPGQAYVPGKVKLQPAAKHLLKQHLDDERIRPLRSQTKKGLGPLATPRVSALLAEWERALPAYLDRLVERREILEFQLPDGKKIERGFVMSAEAALPAEIRERSAELEGTVAELARQLSALQETVARLTRTLEPAARAPASATSAATATAPARDADLARTLHDTYRRLDASGRGYVPIHRLRDAVPAARDEFDRTLARLRRELVVDLQVGSPSDYSADEILASLRDADGTLYLTLSWRR